MGRMRKLLSVVLAVLMVTAMAACGSSQTQEGEKIENESASAGTEQTEEKVKIRCVHLNADETWNDIMENYIKRNLEAEFPNVEVEWEGTGDLNNLLKTYSATGDLPDLWYGDAASATAIINAGNQLNLADYIKKDGFIENYANPDALYYEADKIYAISSGIDAFYTPAVYYNKEIFEQYGLQEPETYEDLIKLCEILIENGVTPMSISGQTGWSVRNFLFFTILLNEDPEAAQALLENKIDFADERVISALEKIEEMLGMGCFPEGVANIDYSTHCALYTEKKTAMIATMSWAYPDLEAAVDTGVFMWPSSNPDVKTGDAIQIWGSALNGWAVNAKGKNVNLAVKIAEYCTEQEAIRHAEKGSVMNFQTDVTSEITSELEKERMELYNDASHYLKTLHLNAMDSATAAEFATYTNLLLSGDYTAEQFSEDFNPIWKSNTWFQAE